MQQLGILKRRPEQLGRRRRTALPGTQGQGPPVACCLTAARGPRRCPALPTTCGGDEVPARRAPLASCHHCSPSPLFRRSSKSSTPHISYFDRETRQKKDKKSITMHQGSSHNQVTVHIPPPKAKSTFYIIHTFTQLPTTAGAPVEVMKLTAD